MKKKRDWNIFISSIFFVLGFSVVFSLVGVLLQSVLSGIAYTVQQWLGRIGGFVIILFGIYLLELLRIPFLEREHSINMKKKFKSVHLASFVFGAAFAVGWTPCVGAVLGAVLTLAISQPTSAFVLMFAYSLGLGIPFLLVGLFTNEAQKLIRNSGRWLQYLKYFFGILLIFMGILVFSDNLSLVANLAFSSNILSFVDAEIGAGVSINIGISFIAGLVSFLSPCVLPLIPAFLSYLASVGVKNSENS